MLTPDLIQKMNQATGNSVSLKPVVTSRADEIRALAKASVPSVPQKTESFYGGGKNSIGQKLIDTVNTGAEELNGPMGMKQLLAPTKAVFRGVGDVAGAVFHPLGVAIDKLTGGKAGQIFNDIGEASQGENSIITKSHILDLPVVQSIAKHVSNDDFERFVNILSLGLANSEKLPNGEKPSIDTLVERTKTQIGDIKNTPQTIINKADEFGNKVKDTVTGKTTDLKNSVMGTPKTDLELLQEKISPKPTAKETKLAMEQGRLYKGKPRTMFKEGGVDRIATSDQQMKSVQTINRNIPDHVSMDEPTLYKALDEKVGDISKKLKPEMQKVPIKEETIQKISDDWSNLKKEQITEAKATDEPNVRKWQANFEKYLKKSGSDNFNDLWESRKNYDASIKDNVKSATEASPEDLQIQKEIWQQNRRILSDAINDGVSGMGKTSQQAFSDMRDMYEAQNGILSKAKVETTKAPSKMSVIKQTVKDNPIISGVTTAATLYGGSKLLGD